MCLRVAAVLAVLFGIWAVVTKPIPLPPEESMKLLGDPEVFVHGWNGEPRGFIVRVGLVDLLNEAFKSKARPKAAYGLDFGRHHVTVEYWLRRDDLSVYYAETRFAPSWASNSVWAPMIINKVLLRREDEVDEIVAQPETTIYMASFGVAGILCLFGFLPISRRRAA